MKFAKEVLLIILIYIAVVLFFFNLNRCVSVTPKNTIPTDSTKTLDTKRDSLQSEIININKRENEEIKKVISLDDDSTMSLFKQLVSE